MQINYNRGVIIEKVLSLIKINDPALQNNKCAKRFT